jgi:hypothetical protein
MTRYDRTLTDCQTAYDFMLPVFPEEQDADETDQEEWGNAREEVT